METWICATDGMGRCSNDLSSMNEQRHISFWDLPCGNWFRVVPGIPRKHCDKGATFTSWAVMAEQDDIYTVRKKTV
jgi:hypothetical protein